MRANGRHEAFDDSFAGSPQEQAGACRRNCVSGGAPAVAAEILGVSRRTVYRSAPVMDAREDLQWRRETPRISASGELPARRGTRLSRQAPASPCGQPAKTF